ncbi:hypothetical protein BJV78DRAFT_1284259 [Lactifluus subvellereus]|nr:hypothetical protein BJV78DRAFT_1284259 [Lactifluus subvellereus]
MPGQPGLWDWESHKEVAYIGLRSTFIVVPRFVHSASKNQISGFNECYEPSVSIISALFLTASSRSYAHGFCATSLTSNSGITVWTGSWPETARFRQSRRVPDDLLLDLATYRSVFI